MGAFLYTKHLENGEVELHNPEGVGIKLSPDQANSFAESMGAKNKELIYRMIFDLIVY